MIARLSIAFVSLASFACAVQPEIAVTTSKPALGDNLALNLADAVIKSIFPEVAEVEKPRRAPVNRLTADGLSSGYSPYSGGVYPIPPGNILPAAAFPGARFQGRTDLPANYIYPYAAPGSLVQSNTGSDPGFFLGPQDLANARNQQYLAYLQQQQKSLQTWQETNLQQQLLQGQAQPYLTAARQQQYNPDLTRQFGGTLALPKQQPQLSVQSPTAAEDGRSRQFGSRNLLPSSASTRVPSFSNPDGAYLEEFFKSYGVDLSKSQSQLTADDNETLTILKEQLIQQQFTTDSSPFVTGHSESGNEPVLEDIEKLSERPKISSSTFTSPTTRVSSPEKETVTDWTSVSATKVTNWPTVSTSDESGSCESCIPIDLQRIVGPWTQIYGNPDALRQIYSTVQSIQDLDLTSDTVNAKMVAGQPSCVGFQLSQRNENEMRMNLFFRDDSKGHKLNEMTGTLRQENQTAILDLELSLLRMPMCVVIAGPTSGSLFEYLVLAETTGVNRCRSHHVFARNTKTFFRKHDSSVADFLEMAVNKEQSLPVGMLPFPRLCQLPTGN